MIQYTKEFKQRVKEYLPDHTTLHQYLNLGYELPVKQYLDQLIDEENNHLEEEIEKYGEHLDATYFMNLLELYDGWYVQIDAQKTALAS